MLRFIRTSLLGFLAVSVIVSLVGLVLWRADGLKLYSVQTDSMSPTFHQGDLVIGLAPKHLQVGDVVGYKSPNGSGQIVSHRIVAIYNHRGYLITRGDSLAVAPSN